MVQPVETGHPLRFVPPVAGHLHFPIIGHRGFPISPILDTDIPHRLFYSMIRSFYLFLVLGVVYA